MKSDVFSLQGKVIVVTGATGVLGYSFNKAIVAAGAKVVILGRNESAIESRVSEIINDGGDALGVVADVTDVQALERAKTLVLNKYGRIDGLVNAAGGNQPGAVVMPDQDIFSLDMNALKDVVNLNLFGTLLPTQVFGPVILNTAGRGSIVNISSVSAHKTLSRVLGYSLAKSAIESYTKWFAVESANRYGDRLRFNAIVPGFFLTEQNRKLLTEEDGSLTARGRKIQVQTPFARFGQPGELSGALVWLLSDASTFVNGTSVIVDGGFLANSGV